MHQHSCERLEEIRDYIEERADTDAMLRRYKKVSLNPAMKSMLGALHAQETNSIGVFTQMNSHLLNAIANMRWVYSGGRVMQLGPNGKLRLETARQQIDQAIAETARLAMTHDALVGQMRAIEKQIYNLLETIMRSLYTIRETLGRAIVNL